ARQAPAVPRADPEGGGKRSHAGLCRALPERARARRQGRQRGRGRCVPQSQRGMAPVPRRRMRAARRPGAERCRHRRSAARLHGRAHTPPLAGHEVTMTLEIYLAYIAACFVIAIIPGPTVTVIVANSLTYGTRAGLLNVAGTQLGLGLMMAILVVGLSSVIAAMGWLFDWLRWAGAAYLIWIVFKLLRSPEAIAQAASAPAPRGGFLLQGFLVLMANPNALLWFGAFIPQFVDP